MLRHHMICVFISTRYQASVYIIMNILLQTCVLPLIKSGSQYDLLKGMWQQKVLWYQIMGRCTIILYYNEQHLGRCESKLWQITRQVYNVKNSGNALYLMIIYTYHVMA